MSCWKLRVRFVLGTCLLLSGCTIRSSPDAIDATDPVKATALVLSDWHPGNAFVVDRAHRLLLTSLYVAGDKPGQDYEVIFPAIEDGKALINRDKIKKGATRIKAHAVYPDAANKDPDLLRDAAIIQVDSLPDSAPELKLATATPENGAAVELLTNGAKPHFVWNYVSTTVKKMEPRQFSGEGIRPINAKMMELSIDSKLSKDVNGAPVVNKDGEVVGLVASFSAQTGPLMVVDQSELRPVLAGAYRELAMQAIEKKKFDEAIALADKSVQLAPSDARSYNERGAAFSWKKQYDKAVENYSQSIKLDPSVALVYRNRASAYSHLEKYDQAVDDCTEALRVSKNGDWRALKLRAEIYRKTNKIKEAEQDEKYLSKMDMRDK